MKAKVICKTVDKGVQSFFVRVNGKDYFLFSQGYKVSVKEFFNNGVCVNGINNYSVVHSTAVRKTLDKLPSYLHYVEKEYGVEIYEKKNQDKKQKAYKREPFRWQDYAWAI